MTDINDDRDQQMFAPSKMKMRLGSRKILVACD